MVKLYTTNCPKCRILEKKLSEKNIEYSTETNVEAMISLGMKTSPNLEVDGEIMDFTKAIQWVNNQ